MKTFKEYYEGWSSEEQVVSILTAEHVFQVAVEWLARMDRTLSQSARETLKPEDLIDDLQAYIQGAQTEGGEDGE